MYEKTAWLPCESQAQLFAKCNFNAELRLFLFLYLQIAANQLLYSIRQPFYNIKKYLLFCRRFYLLMSSLAIFFNIFFRFPENSLESKA